MKCACYLLHTPKRAYKPPEDVCASHCSPASYSFFWRCQPENAPTPESCNCWHTSKSSPTVLSDINQHTSLRTAEAA